jgi:hypothetical protein
MNHHKMSSYIRSVHIGNIRDCYVYFIIYSVLIPQSTSNIHLFHWSLIHFLDIIQCIINAFIVIGNSTHQLQQLNKVSWNLQN